MTTSAVAPGEFSLVYVVQGEVGSGPGSRWNRFIAPIACPRSRSGNACTDRNAPDRTTASTNRGHRRATSSEAVRYSRILPRVRVTALFY